MGAAVYEELKFDASGCITNAQLFDYHIPTLKEAPR
jgi:CO/xanthine dehydrogenase Mo-binding subunit